MCSSACWARFRSPAQWVPRLNASQLEGTHLANFTEESFDVAKFLAKAGVGRKIVRLKAKQPFFTQGMNADCVYYLRSGRVRITVVSATGKEATIAIVSPRNFLGEEALSPARVQRMATATAIVNCVALRIEKQEMIRMLHDEHSFSDLFMGFLLARSMRTQADLIDQLFNSSEKRLARILLLMAEFGKSGEEETLIPPITQETLAEMVGTTRPRVSFFMNRFRKLGLIEYKDRIKVRRSLLDVVLHERLPEESVQQSQKPNTRAKDKAEPATRPTKAPKNRSLSPE